MSLVNSVRNELARSPVATISSAVGILLAGLSLLLAWSQYQSPTASSAVSSPFDRTAVEFNLANLLLVVSYFLAITVPIAFILRAVARKHDVAAFFASIPVVALANFSTIVVIYLVPPRQLSQNVFTSAHDLVFYASSAIVITFCGKAVLRDLVLLDRDTVEKENEVKDKESHVGAAFLLALIVLAVWGWLVFAGQTRLTRTLLPEITHPIEAKPAKTGP